MAFANGTAIKRVYDVTLAERFGFGPEIIFEILPIITALIVGAQSAAGVVAAMDHAIFAAGIAGHTVDDAVFVPIDLLEHFLVGRVMAVGHEIAGRFPAANIAGGNRPCGAGQLAFASEEFLVNRRPENGECFSPLEDIGEFDPGHFASEEELFGIFAEAFSHVFFGGIVIVAGGDGMAIDAEPGEILEHLFQFGDIGFLVNSRIGGDLVTENLGHFYGGDAFLEDTFALDDQVVGIFEAVDMDVPIDPPGGCNGRAVVRFAFADEIEIFFGDELFGEQSLEGAFEGRIVNAAEIFAHFFAHEHSIGANVDDAFLPEQSGDEFLDFWVDERFPAANGNHGSVAFGGGSQAILQAHHVFEMGGVLADPTATRAREVARVKRFQLQHQSKFGCAADFVFDDMAGDFRRQR